MPNVDPDQGLVYPADPDAADNPSAFATFIGGTVGRLVRRYASIADRLARDLAPVENQITGLADVDRVEVWDGVNYVSLAHRALYASIRSTADQTINNSAALANATGFSFAVVTNGVYQWRNDIFYDSTTTEDIQFAFTWPALSSARWGGIGMLDIAAAGTAGSVKNNTQNTSGVGTTYGGAGAGVTISGSLFGEITAGGNGTVQMQFAQAAAALTNTVLRARSRMQVWRVA
jgi:hypothetical protein